MTKKNGIQTFLQRYWWFFLVLALLLVAVDLVPDMVLDRSFTTPYRRYFDGYMLVFDLDDIYGFQNPAPVPLYTEPAHMELEGHIRTTLRYGRQFIGAVRIDGFPLMGRYTEKNGILYHSETRPAPDGDNWQIFDLYTPLRDTGKGYCVNHLSGYVDDKGHVYDVYLENEIGEMPLWVYSLPQKNKYCVEVHVKDDPTAGTSGIVGYMVFPSDTPEEALEIFTNEHLATWREALGEEVTVEN